MLLLAVPGIQGGEAAARQELRQEVSVWGRVVYAWHACPATIAMAGTYHTLFCPASRSWT
jgi:hypothetical protein